MLSEFIVDWWEAILEDALQVTGPQPFSFPLLEPILEQEPIHLEVHGVNTVAETETASYLSCIHSRGQTSGLRTKCGSQTPYALRRIGASRSVGPQGSCCARS